MHNVWGFLSCLILLCGCTPNRYEELPLRQEGAADEKVKTCVERQREYIEKNAQNFENGLSLLIDFLLSDNAVSDAPLCTSF